jgi:hypothetical protein
MLARDSEKLAARVDSAQRSRQFRPMKVARRLARYD